MDAKIVTLELVAEKIEINANGNSAWEADIVLDYATISEKWQKKLLDDFDIDIIREWALENTDLVEPEGGEE